LLFLLSDPSTLGWGLTRSKLLAAEAGHHQQLPVGMTSGRLPTYRGISVHWTRAQRLRRFAKFQLICLAGLVSIRCC